MTSYQQVFQPFAFANGVTLKNRLVMAPMTTWAGNPDGTNSEAEFDYYRARSGGVAMVITGTTFTVRNGQGFPQQFSGADDRFLPNLTRLAETIKKEGAKAILQVFHAGRLSQPELTGNDVVAPSAVLANRPGVTLARALKNVEIPALIASFAATAERAIKAGFDGIEIHGANGYLIQQFFSPHANQRDDEWGGTREKRARFPLAVVDAISEVIRQKAPKGFILGYRFSPEETGQVGIDLEDTCWLVEKLITKPLDYLHISLRDHRLTSQRDVSDKRLIGEVVHRQIAGRKPLIGVGSVRSAQDLESALGLGFELVAIGRALISDAQWVQKIQNGETPIPQVDPMHPDQQIVPVDMVARMKSFFPEVIA